MAKLIASLFLIMFYLSLASAEADNKICQTSGKVECDVGPGGKCTDYCKTLLTGRGLKFNRAECLVTIPTKETFCICYYPC